jgi:lipoate-protein ligase A
MAFDDALLESMPDIDRPVLRFYSWTEPAATFGYFQRYSEIEKLTLLRPLIRRPTGGGLVPHDSDWTYSACFPAGSQWYEFSACASYESIHHWIQQAFEAIHVSVELASSALPSGPGQCFIGYEKSDVLWRGRKIAGAAQRRTRNGLLIQGSVQPPPIKLARDQWETEMLQAKPVAGARTWKEMECSAVLMKRVDDLVEQKFGLESYNRKR